MDTPYKASARFHLSLPRQIHRAVLHGVQGVQTLAGAQRHTADSVVGNHCVNAGPGRHQLIKAGDQAAAARHDDAVGGDVRHQLRLSVQSPGSTQVNK